MNRNLDVETKKALLGDAGFDLYYVIIFGTIYYSTGKTALRAWMMATDTIHNQAYRLAATLWGDPIIYHDYVMNLLHFKLDVDPHEMYYYHEI